MTHHLTAIRHRTEAMRDGIKHRQDLQSRLIDAHLQEIMRHVYLIERRLENAPE